MWGEINPGRYHDQKFVASLSGHDTWFRRSNQFEHPGRSKHKTTTSTQMLNALEDSHEGSVCPSKKKFSIYLNNFSPSRFQDLPPKMILTVTLRVFPLPIAEPRITPTPLSFVRPCPFALPNVCLPISSPRPSTSNGDKHTPSKRNYLLMSFLHALLSIWVCSCRVRVCLLKWPRSFVVNLF